MYENQIENFIHPLDELSIQPLKWIEEFADEVTSFLYEIDIAHYRNECLLNFAFVDELRMPHLNKLFSIAKHRLKVDDINIQLYIQKSTQYNAYVCGIECPIVVLSSSLINDLNNDEILFILGHELGHIKSNHLLYRNMAKNINAIIDYFSDDFKLLSFASELFEGAFLEWHRKSELSADRAGLIVCEDYKSVISTMTKILGITPDSKWINGSAISILEQSIDFESIDKDIANLIDKIVVGSNMTHPWMCSRVHEISIWHNKLNH